MLAYELGEGQGYSIPNHDGACGGDCCCPPVPPSMISLVVQIYQRPPRLPFWSGTHDFSLADEEIVKAIDSNNERARTLRQLKHLR